MAKDPHARKRKKLEDEKRRKARQAESLIYTGDKYKKTEFVPTMMHAERAIFETFLMTGRSMSDQTAITGIKRLVLAMRGDELPPLPDTPSNSYDAGREADLVMENIRRNWAKHFATARRPSDEDLIGILRTILGSIDRWRTPGPGSIGYLHYIAGFLKKAGLTFEVVPLIKNESTNPAPAELMHDESEVEEPAALSSGNSA